MSRLTSPEFPNDWELPAFKIPYEQPRQNRFAVCIFVWNEGEKIRRQLQEMVSITSSVDIIIADGNSTDHAFDDGILERCQVTALVVKTGTGRLSAQMRLGLAYALQRGYEGIITIDGNGKDGIDAIPAFVKSLEEGYDHLQGSRFIQGGIHRHTPLSRLLGVRLLHAPLISLSAGFRYTDTTNGFRGYSRRLLLDDRVRLFRNVFSDYELHYYLAIRAARLGFKIKELPVSRCYPAKGKVPTKISGFRGNLFVLRTLLRAVLHQFDPV